MIIHVGYVKTGSTFLQKQVFIEDHGFKKVGNPHFTRDNLVKPKELFYDPKNYSDHIQPYIDEARAKNLLPVLTFERLSGNPISGGYDQVTICNRLKELFPEAKVLFIFREQSDFLVSSYMQAVREGYAGSIKSYLSPPSTGAKVPQFDMRFVEYSHIIKYYMKLFDEDRVLALPFELFIKEPEKYFERIFGFCGNEFQSIDTQKRVNSADRAIQIRIRSFTNSLFVRDQSNPNPWFPSRYAHGAIKVLSHLVPKSFDRTTKAMYKRIAKSFLNDEIEKDNATLSKICGYDLKSYGYNVKE